MFRCWDIGILSFASVKKLWLKLQIGLSISPQRKMIETWFKNCWAQLIIRNLNFISLNDFVMVQGDYYGKYSIFYLSIDLFHTYIFTASLHTFSVDTNR